jgi:hypothetical protein
MIGAAAINFILGQDVGFAAETADALNTANKPGAKLSFYPL